VFNPEYVLERKSVLFGVVMAGTIAILAVPVIMPHIFHGFHIIHIMLHVGGITLASFLAILSATAYYRLRTKRMGMTLVGFLIFATAECVTLVDATWPLMYRLGTTSLMEVGHLLLLFAFGMLAIGVFRND